MRIEMRLCPDLKKLEMVEPTVIETENEMIINCENDLCKPLIKKSYLVLGKSFMERINKLEECERNNEMFFSPEAPMARFKLVRK